ncbi:MAG TPA: DUF2905 domain-containing protein [Candidatus Sulfotelmatobacter sp.]|nr:DUF2905 domain-containing protein [Candidatus Sulfotelmatobacter sp.]
MNEIGKLLVIVGVLMTLAGVALWSGFGRGWLGRLPGDIHYSRGSFHFYFPIATCLILSALLTLIMWLMRK